MTGRLESVDLLVASALFLGHTTSPWVGANALLTVAGVVLAVAYPSMAGQADTHSLVGYLFLAAGGWGYTLSLIITKRFLVHIPVGLLSLFKLALGTVLFHAISSLQHHTGAGAMGLYSWPLWRSMLWYAPLFVTSTMVLWLRALKLCSPAVLSIGMNSNFVVRARSCVCVCFWLLAQPRYPSFLAAHATSPPKQTHTHTHITQVTIAFGVLIVHKWPTPAECIGGGFILVSILSGIAETIVHGEHAEDTVQQAEAPKHSGGPWPLAAQPAAPAAAAAGMVGAGAAMGKGRVGLEVEGEDGLARLVPPQHKANHLGYEGLEEGVGGALHPFT